MLPKVPNRKHTVQKVPYRVSSSGLYRGGGIATDMFMLMGVLRFLIGWFA